MQALKQQYTDSEIIEYVTNHVDGFEYAQLQTGISKFKLENLLRANDFEYCEYCWEWKPVWSVYFDWQICQQCDESEDME